MASDRPHTSVHGGLCHWANHQKGKCLIFKWWTSTDQRVCVCVCVCVHVCAHACASDGGRRRGGNQFLNDILQIHAFWACRKFLSLLFSSFDLCVRIRGFVSLLVILSLDLARRPHENVQ